MYERRRIYYEKCLSSWDGDTSEATTGVFRKQKEGEMWKMCWNLRVPNAAKMFLWRACQNLLPTKANLQKRGICENSLCSTCFSENETMEHIIWECLAASDVWGGASIKLQKSTCSGGGGGGGGFPTDFTRDKFTVCYRRDRALCPYSSKYMASQK
jgi:hypothetical protein